MVAVMPSMHHLCMHMGWPFWMCAHSCICRVTTLGATLNFMRNRVRHKAVEVSKWTVKSTELEAPKLSQSMLR